MTYFITLIVAVCSILYELILAQSLSLLMGNTVLRYSVTIGLYLFSLGAGALLCERWGWSKGSARPRLIRVELLLGLAGGASVLLLGLFAVAERIIHLYLGYHWGEPGSFYQTVFLILLHLPIILIGLLSGCEIPLLVNLKSEEDPLSNPLNKILAVDYFGALLGSILFPIYLLPQWGLYATAFATAFLNGLACLALTLTYRPILKKATYAGVALVILMGVGILQSQSLQQATLRYYYYFFLIYEPTFDLWRPLKIGDDIQRIPSRFQRVELIPYGSLLPPDLLQEDLGAKFRAEPDFPRYWVLRLNRRAQWSSNLEEYYHEPFAHFPIQVRGSVPRKVLILGGGDGLLARELLKYPQVHITQVELDPTMIETAKHHPIFRAMNHGSFDDPRVTIVQQDALIYLSQNQESFDAIYADFPVPVDYDLSRLYSATFLELVRQHLSDNGFAVMDVPFETGSREWSILMATAKAAQWHDLQPFGEKKSGESFILGWSDNGERTNKTAMWHDWNIPLYMLNATSMAQAVDYGARISAGIDPHAPANTLDRPRLPLLGEQKLVAIW